MSAQLNDGTGAVDTIAHLFETMTTTFQRLNEPLFIFVFRFDLGLEYWSFRAVHHDLHSWLMSPCSTAFL